MRMNRLLECMVLIVFLLGASSAWAHTPKAHKHSASHKHQAHAHHVQLAPAQGSHSLARALRPRFYRFSNPVRWLRRLTDRANRIPVPVNNTLNLTGTGYEKWLTLALQQGRANLLLLCPEYAQFLAERTDQVETDYLADAKQYWRDEGESDPRHAGAGHTKIGERLILLSAIQFLSDRGVHGQAGDPDQPACDECLDAGFSLYYCRHNPSPTPYCNYNEP